MEQSGAGGRRSCVACAWCLGRMVHVTRYGRKMERKEMLLAGTSRSYEGTRSASVEIEAPGVGDSHCWMRGTSKVAEKVEMLRDRVAALVDSLVRCG